MKVKLFYTIILLIFSINTFSQVTKIRGKITDKLTNEPIPFANINFNGTTVGCITDFEGNYSLEARIKVDTVEISFLGYKTIKQKVKYGSYQEINVSLEAESITIDEVTITPGENPAYRIIRNIIKNKDKNDPDLLKTYQYEVYNKMQIDINNVDDEFKNQRAFKQFKFVFDYVDTSAISGKAYLPVFISETLSDFYYSEEPKREKEIVKASKISGVQDASITQFTGSMYQKTNLYKSDIDVFGKMFVGPFSPLWRAYYKYYLVDSAFVDNHWSYQISFKPRSSTEPTFSGDFWVADTSWALEEVNMKITKEANINLIQNLVVNQKYQETINSIWMLKSEKLLVDFNITKKTIGFNGRKTTIYDKFIVNTPQPEDFFKSKSIQNIDVQEDALDKTDEYWANARKEELSTQEQGIYNMVDTIKSLPLFKTYIDIITTFVTGYYDIGKFELGPYSKLFSFNSVEGYRFRFGARTSIEFNDKLFLEGFVAYGTKDLTYKGGFDVKYLFKRNPEIYLGIKAQLDVEQLGQGNNIISSDNILNSAFKRTSTDKLNLVKNAKIYFGKEWYEGFSNNLIFSQQILIPIGSTTTDYLNNKWFVNKSGLNTSEISLSTRFAYNEKYYYAERGKIAINTRYPIINLNLTAGIKGILNSEYEYQKVDLTVSDYLHFSILGETFYFIETGKIFGTLPYPLLQLQKGNETYWYNDYSFNLMNYYEFITDQYLAISVTHRFQGLFLNKIPLMKKLKWREVIMGKGVVGSLTKENQEFSKFPTETTALTKPYFETSAGIENIFQILRIDAVWRLSYLDKANIDKFGLRIKLQIQF